MKVMVIEIKPCQSEINNLKKSEAQKIKLTIAINFISSKDTDEERVMHSKSDSLEPMIYDKAGELIQEVIFESILSSNIKHAQKNR